MCVLNQGCLAGDVIATTNVSNEEVTDIPASLSAFKGSREQILATQFECYLKILHEPPRTEPGQRH